MAEVEFNGTCELKANSEIKLLHNATGMLHIRDALGSARFKIRLSKGSEKQNLELAPSCSMVIVVSQTDVFAEAVDGSEDSRLSYTFVPK